MNEKEYFATLPHYINNNHYSEPLYDCPECGKLSVCRDNMTCLTSYPPQSRYKCLKEHGGCGNYITSH